MEKKTYYVSVQAGTVLEDRGDAAYEFEIVADDREIDDLIEAFETISDLDNLTSVRSHLPGIPYHQDEQSDNYDIALTSLYRKLYELGTDETKRVIAGMGSIGEQERPIPL